MIIINQYAKELEQLWNAINWKRKIMAYPDYYFTMPFLAHSYSLEEIKQLESDISTLEEETDEGCYTAWLFESSSGLTLAITFSEYDEA